MCEDKKVCKIGDDRLVGYKNRTRSGSEQVFYTGNDARDFDRYKADGGGSKHNINIHDKPDTIRIQPPEKHYYSKLIDGEWWWVNGCPECNGEVPEWAYVKCDKHDVCVTCQKPHSEIKDSVWGHKEGFRCNPCQDAISAAAKLEALSKVAEKEYDEWDYRHTSNVVCPHCASEYTPDEGPPEGRENCNVCGGEYEVEPEYEVTYTTTVIGKRLTA